VCETWSLTLRKEHRCRGFEDKVVRKIPEPEGDEGSRDSLVV
jgi:hypothetical protein